MPQRYFTVEEVGTRYIDPISRQIIRSTLSRLGLWEYFGLGIFINNQRTAISRDDDGQGNIRMGNNRCDVEIETHFNPTDQMWDRAMDYNSPSYGTSKRWVGTYESIFNDPEVGVSIQELTKPFGMTMTFRLTFKSFDAAQKARDRIDTLCNGDVVNQSHDIVYSYPIGQDLSGILGNIYRARSSLNTTYGFNQYVNMMAQSQIGYDVNKYDIGQGKQVTEWVVKKQQLDCLALMQCTQSGPIPEMQEDVSDAWSVEFTYQFQAGRPQTLQLTFPVLIEQNPLPREYFIPNKIDWIAGLVGSMQNATFNAVLRRYSDYRNGDVFLIRFPDYDDWTPPAQSILARYKYSPLCMGITQIDPTKPTTVCLNDLGDVSFSNEVKAILAQHSGTDLFGFEGLFNVSVYANNIRVDPSLLSFDPETLTISYTVTRTTCVYRVVISEAMTVRTLHPKWLEVVLQYRYYYPMTIARSLDYLVKMGRYHTVASGLADIVDKLIRHKGLDSYIQAMIDQGEADGSLYQFTQTANQFADYISNTRAKRSSNETESDQNSKTLYDVFVALLVKNNVIAASQIPEKFIQSRKGYPYGPGSGGFTQFNLPLRIFNTVLTAG